MENVNFQFENFQHRRRIVNLARLITGRDIRVEFQSGIATASYTDIPFEMITFPIFKHDTPIVLLKLFSIHESGHALYTKSEDWRAYCKKTANKLKISESHIHDLVNIIEDVRINKLLKEVFPGSKEIFYNGYKNRYELSHYGTNDPDTLNKMPFVDRINLASKIGQVVNIKFSEEEQKIYDDIVDNIRNWSDVINYSNIVLDFLESTLTSGSKRNKDVDFGKLIDPDMPFIIESDERPPFTFETEDNEHRHNSIIGDDNTETEENINSDAKENKTTDDEEKVYSPLELLLESRTYRYESKSKESYLTSDPIAVYDYDEINKSSDEFKSLSFTPEDISKFVDYCNTITENGSRLYGNWKREFDPRVNKMVSIFNMKAAARSWARTQVRNTGIISPEKLPYYKLTDNIFKKNTIVDKGINHGFIILLDTSGSMAHSLKKTVRQTMSIVSFARKIGAPFKVYTFSDMKTQILSEIIHSDMNNNEFNKVFRYLAAPFGNIHNSISADGGTPLDISILGLIERSVEFTNKHLIDILNFIIVTDGESGPLYFTGVGGDRLPAFNDYQRYIKYNGVMYQCGDRNNTKTVINIFKTNILTRTTAKINVVNFFLEDQQTHEVSSEIYDLKFIINTYDIGNTKDDEFQINNNLEISRTRNGRNAYGVFLTRIAEIMAIAF